MFDLEYKDNIVILFYQIFIVKTSLIRNPPVVPEPILSGHKTLTFHHSTRQIPHRVICHEFQDKKNPMTSHGILHFTKGSYSIPSVSSSKKSTSVMYSLIFTYKGITLEPMRFLTSSTLSSSLRSIPTFSQMVSTKSCVDISSIMEVILSKITSFVCTKTFCLFIIV